MISRTFKLCLNAGSGSAPYINVNQYDEGETWLFELYSENGERYIPSSGAIVGVKSDGHGIVNTGTVDSEGRVVITETQQMTASAGRAIYELSIDGLTHGTANFIVAVERKPTDDAVMSDSDLSLIQEAIDSAEVIVEVIGDGDPSEVIGEHVDAWLDNHPEATTTVEDGAITAPKINQSLWDKLLVSEEASGVVASFDDGADDVPVSSLKVNLEPIQLGSGDPSPTNVRPIIAANGKNLLNIPNMDTTFGALTVKSNNGVCVANGTATSGTTCTLLRMTGTLPAGEYILNGNANFTQQIVLQVYSYTRSSNIARCLSNADVTFTVNANEDIVVVLYVISGQTLNNFTFYPMIRLASITDASYQPYQGIMVERTGRNLISATDQSFTASTTTYVEVTRTVTLKAGTYTLSYNMSTTTTGSRNRPYYKHNNVSTYSNNDMLSAGRGSWTFTLAEDGDYIFAWWNQNLASACSVTDFMLESGSSASDYEPFISTTYPYTLGQSVYGGTVDLATGVLTVTHVYYQRNFSTPTSKDSQNRWIMSFYPPNASSALFGKMWGLTTYAADYGFLSDSLQIHLENAEVANASTCAFYGHGSTFEYRVRVPDTYTADEAKAIADANHIVYPIEPQTIQLTPQEVKTLRGYNNISSSGTVDVIYHADTKLYVDKMTNVDNDIIAPTEATFTATRNYTVNDLVIVNDTLYKVTSNIANGGTITPNSNVQQTTLGALIKALS